MVKDVSAQSNVITSIGAGRFRLRSVYVRQDLKNAGAMYLQIFNKNAAIPGTDIPDEVVFLPNQAVSPFVKRLSFSGSPGANDFITGLSFAVCTTPTGAVDVGATKRPFVRIDYDGSTLGGAV